MSLAARLSLIVLIGGFGWGVFTHAADFMTGRAPYTHGTGWQNAFWNGLVLMDAAVVVLLLRWRRAGILAAAALMIGDVAVNSRPAWADGAAFLSTHLVWQAAFLGFVIGSGAMLWRETS